MSTHFPDGHEREVDEVERPEPLRNFYDEGWNARVAGEPFTAASSRSWQDGWKDCDGAPEADRTPMGALPAKLPLTEKQIKHMVDRFLGWRLPEDFNPDCGTQFDADAAKKLNPRNARYEPTGTNVFDAQQATAMVRYMIDGLPS